MSDEHCKDCCCARSWTALDVHAYTGKSIPEHIEALRATNERLIHDIERSQTAAADLATENARLREWLAVAVEVYEALNGPAVSDGHWANQSKKALEGGAT